VTTFSKNIIQRDRSIPVTFGPDLIEQVATLLLCKLTHLGIVSMASLDRWSYYTVTWLDRFQCMHKIYSTYMITISFCFVVQRVWTLYKQSCQETGRTSVALSTFRDYWHKLLPNIIIGKLCWTCQLSFTIFSRSVNTPEEEKSEVHKMCARTLTTTTITQYTVGLWF